MKKASPKKAKVAKKTSPKKAKVAKKAKSPKKVCIPTIYIQKVNFRQ